MGENTAIAWCDHSFSPWWGCSKVSAACANCYAKAQAERFGHTGFWGRPGKRRRLSDANWRKPLTWARKAEAAGERHRVFCASMCDVFEYEHHLNPERGRLFELIEATPQLDWLLLTKRPENMTALTPIHWNTADGWPPNVWALTTVEEQGYVAERVRQLLKVPARVRGISVEPMLGPVEIPEPMMRGLDWVIVGCESGPARRQTDLAWVRALRDQCVADGVAFFCKQLDAGGKVVTEPELDGERWLQFPHPPVEVAT